MSGILVPAARFSTESWVKNSHFIASIGPVFSVPEAKEFIAEINQLYSDATHNVPVYLIGSGSSVIAHSSDNGEPSGTAGRPALAVLTGSGLGDTALVITRYFGGTKLGTGGLVKAYSNAARDAVQGVPKAKKISIHQASLSCHYKLYENTLRLIKKHQGFNIHENFTDHVRIDFSLPIALLPSLQSRIDELSNGQIKINIEKRHQTALQPLKSPEDIANHA